MIRNFRKFDPKWKDIDLDAVPKAAFLVACDSILEAMANPDNWTPYLPVGRLVSVTVRKDSGYLETSFRGGPGAVSSWLNPRPRRFVKGIFVNRPQVARQQLA